MNLNLRTINMLFGDLPPNACDTIKTIPFVEEGENLVFDANDIQGLSLEDIEGMSADENDIYRALAEGFNANPKVNQIILQPR